MICAGLLALMLSCNSNTDAALINGVSQQQRTSVAAQLKGGWINKRWFDELKKTRSPALASQHAMPLREIAFDLTDTSGNVMMNRVGALNYPGGERFDIELFSTGNEMAIKMHDPRQYTKADLRLDFLKKPDDTLLVLYHDSKHDTVFFQKVLRAFFTNDQRMISVSEYAVNTVLLEGYWLQNGKDTISFSADGTVNGLKKWESYAVETEFVSGPSSPDVITFYNKEEAVSYVFTIDEGIMNWYEYIPEDIKGQWSRGRLKSVLEKINR